MTDIEIALVKYDGVDDLVYRALKEMQARENTPKADAAEVKHAEWIQVRDHSNRNNMGCKCSECGRRVANQDYGHTDHYCPKCGAKMDKRRESEVSE